MKKNMTPFSQKPISVNVLVTLALTGLVGLGQAQAQQVDAGSVMRDELRRDQGVSPAMPPLPATQESLKPLDTQGAKFEVKGFRLLGLSALPETEVQLFLGAYAGQLLTLNALHQITDRLEQWLKSKGLFVARAYVPPQDIRDGIVEVRIQEGRLEGVDIKIASGARASEESLRAVVSGALPNGEAIHLENLERGTLLLNDLPATSARAVLAPGKELGTSRIVIEAAQGPVLAGTVDLDNTGSRFTGDWRLSTGLTINDPLGLGDQWTVRLTGTEGSQFARLAYSLPLGHSGLKAGLSYLQSHYTLCCAREVDTLGTSGVADAWAAFLSYPFIRTRLNNLTASVNVAKRTFENRTGPDLTSDKASDTVGLGITGDRTDLQGLLGQGAFSSYGLQWTNGRVKAKGPATFTTQDQSTAQELGSFNKLTVQGTHLVRVTSTGALYLGVAGQWSEKNLDSSEKFVLGGMQGVRAYPTGEGAGDQGWLANLEYRQDISREWRVTAFYDYGEVRLHRNTWSNWGTNTVLAERNRYALEGFGASLTWSPTTQTQITAILASRLGQNPARDTTNRDSDNRKSDPRLWVQANMAF